MYACMRSSDEWHFLLAVVLHDVTAVAWLVCAATSCICGSCAAGVLRRRSGFCPCISREHTCVDSLYSMQACKALHWWPTAVDRKTEHVYATVCVHV